MRSDSPDRHPDGAGAVAPRAAADPGAGPSPAMTADDLVAATGGTLLRRSARPIRGAAVDSRLVAPGELFVALVGERTDGHRYLADAAIAGAAALLVGRVPDPGAGEPSMDALGDVTVVLVPDPLRGLHAVAAAWRRRFEPIVVGITGSIAKTSTKEAVAAVLGPPLHDPPHRGQPEQRDRAASDGSAAGAGARGGWSSRWGCTCGGEIRDLAAIGRPSIGVVTAVQPVHLSRIGSLDAIEDAKAELVEALPPASDGGVAVLNADDDRVRRMASRTAAMSLTYGFAADAGVRATDIASTGARGHALPAPCSGGRARGDHPRAGPDGRPQRARCGRGRARRRHDPRRDRAGAGRRRERRRIDRR